MSTFTAKELDCKSNLTRNVLLDLMGSMVALAIPSCRFLDCLLAVVGFLGS